MPYNLPPDKCLKQGFIFLALVIPGPKEPKQQINIFLHLLMEELKELWQGVDAYDSTHTSTVPSATSLADVQPPRWLMSWGPPIRGPSMPWGPSAGGLPTLWGNTNVVGAAPVASALASSSMSTNFSQFHATLAKYWFPRSNCVKSRITLLFVIFMTI
jgi:hypothetical protein